MALTAIARLDTGKARGEVGSARTTWLGGWT